MEIKCAQKEKIEYPKINEISNIKVKYAIPDKWIKLGITSFVLELFMREKVFAVTPSDISTDAVIAGGVSYYYNPTYDYVISGCNMVALISALTFVVSAIMIVYKKIKKREQKIKLKIVFIISIILLVLSRVGVLIANYLKY